MENTNTERSFRDKWNNNPNLVFEETLTEDSEIHQWILNRNGFNNQNELRLYLKDKRRILDAGCGNGRVTALLANHSSEEAEIVGIDLVSSDIAKMNLLKYNNVKIFSKDLLVSDLTDLGIFDFIYCQEVLHHTKDPLRAFNNLVSLLSENGEIAIYVYKKKAPIREYTDDFIRSKIKDLAYQDALEVNNAITELGRTLSNIKTEVTLPEIEVLEIPAGTYTVQRLFYHFFIKCFWNDRLSYDENVAINYDWYHPQDCSRHTLEEVRSWFNNSGLEITHEFVDFYGITIKGRKNH